MKTVHKNKLKTAKGKSCNKYNHYNGNNKNNKNINKKGCISEINKISVNKNVGKKLSELDFWVTSSCVRNASERTILKKFYPAFYENKALTLKWLFYARDCRGGLGEKKLFKICLSSLAQREPKIVLSLIPFVPEYGRWDDLFCLIDTPLENIVIDFLFNQLTKDAYNMSQQKSISLLAKWLPTETAHSKGTKYLFSKFCIGFGLSARSYRKVLSSLREYIKITERYMSLNEWQEIDYSSVPERANNDYNNAFIYHDKERRTAYAGNIQKKKIPQNNISLKGKKKNKEERLIDKLKSDRYKVIKL